MANISNPSVVIRCLLIKRETFFNQEQKVVESVVEEYRGIGKVCIPIKWIYPYEKFVEIKDAASNSKLENLIENESENSATVKQVEEATSKTSTLSAKKSNTSVESRSRSPNKAKKGGSRAASANSTAKNNRQSRENSAKSRMSQVSVRSELSVTRMPSVTPDPVNEMTEQEKNLHQLLNPSEDLKSRSYFIELVYEKWDFSDGQSKYIDMLKSQQLLEHKVFEKEGNANPRKGSANSNKKGKAAAPAKGNKKDKSSPVPTTPSQTEAIASLEDKDIPKYAVSFVLDREMIEEIDIKLDTEIEEWLKNEKRSWSALDEAQEGLPPRHERAAKARNDWLESRKPKELLPEEAAEGEETETPAAPVVTKQPPVKIYTEEELYEKLKDSHTKLYENHETSKLLTKDDHLLMDKNLQNQISKYKQSREDLKLKFERMKVDNDEKLNRMRCLNDIFA